MRGPRVCGIAACFTLLTLAAPRFAIAQVFDPRPILSQLIQAFQMCGPPQVYQILSPQLFQIVAQQTQGTGCYQQISAAGPVQSMQVISQQQYPIGPIYVVRVNHPGTTADWIIGFNQFTSKVEHLTFQAAQGAPVNLPPIAPGPRRTTPQTPSPPTDKPPNTSGDGCDLFPAMCQ